MMMSECQFCHQWFPDGSGLRDHMREKHPNRYAELDLLSGGVTDKGRTDHT